MAAPWNNPGRQGANVQFNPQTRFQDRQNSYVRLNNPQEWMNRPPRQFSPVRNNFPGQNQEFRHAPPQQTQNFQSASGPRGLFPPAQPNNVSQPVSQFPRQQSHDVSQLVSQFPRQQSHDVSQPVSQFPRQQSHDVSQPVSQFPRQQSHAVSQRVSQFPRQQGMPPFHENANYQWHNQSLQNVPPQSLLKTEQKFAAFDSAGRGGAFLENTDRYQDSSMPPIPQQLQPGYVSEQGFASQAARPGISDRATTHIEDADRQSAEVWIKHWLQKRKKPETTGKKKKTITISEAQEKTRQMIVLLARLQKNKQQLESMVNEDKSIWEQKHREVTKIKSEFEVLHETLTNEETVAELAKKVRQRQTKRRRLKRVRQEQYTRQQQEQARREEKHAEMDTLMEQLKHKQQHQKQEEAMKKEGDQILSEVKKKMSEATKATQLLDSLQKLRKLRADRFDRQGVLGMFEGAGHKQRFEETVTGLTGLLNTQSGTYKAEEAALKVILETEQEETREKEREKHTQQQLHNHQQTLFGCHKEARPGDPLYPFAQYYKAAENSIDALISIRHDWDMHLVLPETPGASQIPRPWVHPHEPSSKSWRSALAHKTDMPP